LVGLDDEGDLDAFCKKPEVGDGDIVVFDLTSKEEEDRGAGI
jgi:hypothetical protein